ncbi:aldo/keto reductase [Haloarcula argentinensis]|uniref:Aldehyde oxidoreductase n=1 Tax=Haloarcula argentinensis TaxID=43776 RepID=A0A830FGP7_HALAR|nr:aldo/keto reductase [Haloarcula argentinensis]EMA18951.1 aldo/keto reductase family oxidoreductase [Haloarcula argentinensis DSM 12282]MDS0254050.1 aldo/keto reductase [Haloarcula argentinensis]GGM44604.1 aldehyde oxidoreductase [Haloarcula argentinensis]
MDLPPVGLGTMGIEDEAVVRTAIDCGYRHLDTAQIYDNERTVGAGIASAETDRVDLTVATKLWIDALGATAVRPATEASLDRLGLDAIDLLYIHRPRGDYDPETTLPAVEALRERGLTEHVGLSNFDPDQLAVARDHLDGIAAHQVEFHPLFWREPLLADAQKHGYPLVAYAPLAGGRVFENPTIVDIADQHNTSPAAVSIAWVTSYENVVTIPKASSRSHLEANLAAADLELTDAEIARIEAIEREEELFPE